MASIEETPHNTYRVRWRTPDGKEHSQSLKRREDAVFIAKALNADIASEKFQQARERIKMATTYEKPQIDTQEDEPWGPPLKTQTDATLVQTAVSPFQRDILRILLNSPNKIATSKVIAETLDSRPQAVGAAANLLRRSGLTTMMGKGVWAVNDGVQLSNIKVTGTQRRRLSRAKPKPTLNEDLGLQMGDLFEVVGQTADNAFVVRGVETHKIFKMAEL